MAEAIATKPTKAAAGLGTFERYLSVWVALCMVAGVGLGKLLPAGVAALRAIEFGKGSQINAPIAVLIWLMITPMMMKVDFSSVKNVGRRPAGLLVTLFINWLVKPFSMALLAWAFFRFVFAAFITSAEADQYIAGCIILAAAPCTAMVFVWSHLTNGDAAYTLVQVSVNDLVMLVLFVPIVQFLVHGASSLTVPSGVLLTSVVVFIVVPLAAGVALRSLLVRKRGRAWFEGTLLPKFAPVTIAALLGALVLIFAFQADNITGRFFQVLLIAVPITLQVYLNAGLAYGLMKFFKVEHSVAAPGALIGASNFFELAVATAIALFGPAFGRGAGHGGRRSGGSAGDALGLLGMQPHAPLVPCRERRIAMAKKRVLILCTGNSARSQMAEGLLRHLAGDRFDVESAGIHPSCVRPEAIAVLRELGIDLSAHRSKPVDEFAEHAFDVVITVCDHAREHCPIFSGAAQRIHWSFEDPAALQGTEPQRLAAFREIRDQIAEKIRSFIECG